MSAFEKLPREIRDHIYELCLVDDRVIDPFPYKGSWEWDPVENPRSVEYNPFLGYSNRAPVIDNKPKPCVALLGVNSNIRDEAATTLFGRNTWRLSSGKFERDEKCRWWNTYAQYFRHLVTSFDSRDADQEELLDIWMGEIERASEDSDHFNPAGTANIHQSRLNSMRDSFITKKNILLQMDLKTLSIDLRYLFCSSRCCRPEAIQTLLQHLGTKGPWYKLEQEQARDRDTKPRTDVKLRGLKNDEEKKLFWDTWGLEAD